MNYETQSSRERGFIYWVALGLLAVFVLIALFTLSSARQKRQVSEKADEYIAALEDAGMTAPSKEQITRLLGDDGGALCDDPGAALRRAIANAQLTNGASDPGMRPILADVRRLLQGQLTAIQVYCPDELADFRDYVDDLESESVTEG
jgi:Tfp pilus assembly protein FimT